MNNVHITKPMSAIFPPLLRLWVLPFLVVGLITINLCYGGLDTVQSTMIASVAIVVAGIPHGTLDIEIAAARFGNSGTAHKLIILAAYVGCAAMMIVLWQQIPELALTAFLIISIIHFSADWRGGVEPFLAMMVGWALIALPALSHPQSAAMIFEILTGNQNGTTIAAVLACTSVPATLGSIVFAFWSYQKGDYKTTVDMTSCLVAAICLPPLIAFSIFFCGLHSPRHMADALRDTGGLSPRKKAIIIAAVFCLSAGIGVVLFMGGADAPMDVGIIQTAFVLLSTLTVPHFILEHIMAAKNEHKDLVLTGISER
jgi:beta-carotene 15,15'-dioxygenase